MGNFAILLVDTVARAEYSVFGCFGATSTKVSKGELLIASEELVQASDELEPLYIVYLANKETTTLCAEVDGSTAATLTDQEFMLLRGITSSPTRFDVFHSGKCSWGSSLRVGDATGVDITSVDTPVSAIIRYIGEISGRCGTMFGVELTNEEFSECGEADGTWQGKRYFTCKAKSGLFVSLDKLSPTEGSIEVEAPLVSTPQESREADQTTITLSSHCDERETPARFERGSLIQVIDPPLYGVIRIMETLPKIQGMAAGIELEEDRKNCTDGTWQGKRYFTCPPRRGFFCPLSNLKLDQRFEPTVGFSLLNPLKNCPLEEPEDQPISDDQLVKYLGEGHGIQGHYNSCYLDATVFGLFALSDVFDPMLRIEARDPAGEEIRGMLWRGIVNPLRKNGVVRHESIMSLRNKLEELGKIKGVNLDEKDPEEFLNMLFKHALSVDPFISIRRPFGIEEEFFVQLFLEPDESLELPPTVGQLLTKMFKEQNISFTKAPNKLLIQIPRYGKQFKTYKKVIAGLQLDNMDLIDASGSQTSTIQQSDKEAKDLQLLSVICIQTSHYVCFTRSVTQNRWIFFDSMADRVHDKYNIPKGVDCTEQLNKWVYSGDKRLQSTPYHQLPELVRRFTHDIYLCVYIRI